MCYTCKINKLFLLEWLHTTQKVKENPCLLGKELSTQKNKRLYLIKLTYLNNHMLAENGMGENQW
jgi:hypothetical protein